MTKKEKKHYPVTYSGETIMVPLDSPPRKGVCDACGREISKEIKKTDIHHFKYVYRIKQVRDNPLLALDNTAELCYSDHRIGDSLRVLLGLKEENLDRIINVAKLMPPDMLDKMDIVCKKWLIKRKRKTKRKLEDYTS